MFTSPLYATIAIAVAGFAVVAVQSEPSERRHHFALMFIALFVAAMLLLIVPPG